MLHEGSASITVLKPLTASSYQNECRIETARSNRRCASGLHDTEKWTSPSSSGVDCPEVGWTSKIPAAAVMATANDILIMDASLIFSRLGLRFGQWLCHFISSDVLRPTASTLEGAMSERQAHQGCRP